eukprot:m.120330 g.120330  ORF g.120330 m.120330 type:complete len:578 (-) comp13686_c0_seq4:383-2116(-)
MSYQTRSKGKRGEHNAKEPLPRKRSTQRDSGVYSPSEDSPGYVGPKDSAVASLPSPALTPAGTHPHHVRPSSSLRKCQTVRRTSTDAIKPSRSDPHVDATVKKQLEAFMTVDMAAASCAHANPRTYQATGVPHLHLPQKPPTGDLDTATETPMSSFGQQQHLLRAIHQRQANASRKAPSKAAGGVTATTAATHNPTSRSTNAVAARSNLPPHSAYQTIAVAHPSAAPVPAPLPTSSLPATGMAVAASSIPALLGMQPATQRTLPSHPIPLPASAYHQGSTPPAGTTIVSAPQSGCVAAQARQPEPEVLTPELLLNHRLCMDYIDPIHTHLRQRQGHFFDGINAGIRGEARRFRARVVDWMAEVHGVLQNNRLSTLLTAVNIFDRYLMRTEVPIARMQCVGAAALLVASKMEEILPMDPHKLVYYAAGSFPGWLLLKTEREMIAAVQFELTVPVATQFLGIFNAVVKAPPIVIHIASYLIEIAQQELDFLGVYPDLLASAALHVAVCTHYTPIPGHAVGFTPRASRLFGIDRDVMLSIADQLVAIAAADVQDLVSCRLKPIYRGLASQNMRARYQSSP